MKKYILFFIGTIIFIVFISNIGFKEIGNAISSISFIYVFSIILLNVPVLLLKTWRWKFLLAKYSLSLSFFEMFAAVSAGFFLGLVTPGTVGELGRTLTTNIEKSKGVATVVYEKFFDFLTLFLLSVCSLLIYFLNPLESIIILIIISLTVWGIIYFSLKKKNYIYTAIKFTLKPFSKFKFTDKINNLYKIFNSLLQDPKAGYFIRFSFIESMDNFRTTILFNIKSIKYYFFI